MTTRSISQQIIDEFIGDLSKNKTLKEPNLVILKMLLSSGKFKKNDIVTLLKEEGENENP